MVTVSTCMVTGAVNMYKCITVKRHLVRGQDGYCQYMYGDRGCHLYKCITVKGQPVRGPEGYCQYMYGDRGCHLYKCITVKGQPVRGATVNTL